MYSLYFCFEKTAVLMLSQTAVRLFIQMSARKPIAKQRFFLLPLCDLFFLKEKSLKVQVQYPLLLFVLC